MRQLIRGRNGPLAQLVEGNARRVALDTLLEQFLDRPFREHVQVATVRGDVLVLCADSPTWGHRIRYLAPAILDHFVANGLPDLSRVSIVVRSELTDAPSTVPTRPAMSRRSAHHLEQAADSIEDDDLAARLRALARHHASPDSGG